MRTEQPKEPPQRAWCCVTGLRMFRKLVPATGSPEPADVPDAENPKVSVYVVSANFSGRLSDVPLTDEEYKEFQSLTKRIEKRVADTFGVG